MLCGPMRCVCHAAASVRPIVRRRSYRKSVIDFTGIPRDTAEIAVRSERSRATKLRACEMSGAKIARSASSGIGTRWPARDPGCSVREPRVELHALWGVAR